ncbi:hypothetical protein Y886_32615, partial [Xanthomonas hyacinthi DSM 19077]
MLSSHTPRAAALRRRVSAASIAAALAASPYAVHAQDAKPPVAEDAATLDSIQVAGSWLGTGLQDSVKTFAGARTVLDATQIRATGA